MYLLFGYFRQECLLSGFPFMSDHKFGLAGGSVVVAVYSLSSFNGLTKSKTREKMETLL